MKKSIVNCLLSSAFLLIITSCGKTNRSYMNQIKNESGISIKPYSLTKEKSLILSDEELISAINGENEMYTDINKLEQLLIENAPLSKVTLFSAINNARIPNEMIELFLTISIQNSRLIRIDEIQEIRSNLLLDKFIALIDETILDKFIIVNTNPKTIIFGSEIEHSRENNNSCNSIIIGSEDSYMTELQNIDIEPNAMGANCDGTKQVCGTASYVKKEGRKNTRPIYKVYCNEPYNVVCVNGTVTE